ncbi:conserved hypothetical protein [Lodderomyces elongisporus NRRL YB-4239]|uniref:Uncharacterized protein n=1 Tax=Lodderomyces elongisporus (strain ATCC 11503 / CBS 2605 / JCM 1781 / NBRC 1676 / NRRL YB-4239) TaxID=379508 RepID=A5E143_LODEL|nr:conserved hypothetical protein [Lodderomyces elongisporus NRRL YB-4239]
MLHFFPFTLFLDSNLLQFLLYLVQVHTSLYASFFNLLTGCFRGRLVPLPVDTLVLMSVKGPVSIDRLTICSPRKMIRPRCLLVKLGLNLGFSVSVGNNGALRLRFKACAGASACVCASASELVLPSFWLLFFISIQLFFVILDSSVSDKTRFKCLSNDKSEPTYVRLSTVKILRR